MQERTIDKKGNTGRCPAFAIHMTNALSRALGSGDPPTGWSRRDWIEYALKTGKLDRNEQAKNDAKTILYGSLNGVPLDDYAMKLQEVPARETDKQ
jgi:hypothetical protein